MMFYGRLSEKERNIIRNVLLEVEGELIDHTTAETEDIINCITCVRERYGIFSWC